LLLITILENNVNKKKDGIAEKDRAGTKIVGVRIRTESVMDDDARAT
jgi:hypothetical protein